MNLYEAIRDNNVKKVKSILSKNRDVVNTSRAYGSPLLISAEGGYIEIIKILLKHHADPNSIDSNGWTPLISACQFNHLNAVLLLLENNADPNIQCILGNTALHAAARNDNVKILQALLDSGSYLDVLNVDGWTPLHRAVYSNRISAAKFLLEKGADPTLRSKTGRTPYDTAVHMRLYDLAHVLRKYQGTAETSTPTDIISNNNNNNNNNNNTNSSYNNDSIDSGNNISSTPKPRPRLTPRRNDPFKAFARRLGLLKPPSNVNSNSYPLPTNSRNTLTYSRSSVIPPDPRGDNAESSSDDDDEEGIKNECPICFEIPLPPTHIYQCTNGHIYCEKCKRKPNMRKCPQCGINISGTENRNRYAEEHIAELYKKKTK